MSPLVARQQPGRRARGADAWPTHDEELLLRAALLHDERALDAWNELRPQIDLATLDGASIAAIPTLRRNLVALGIDDELFTVFKGVHRFSWARNQVLLDVVLPMVARIESAGVPTMLLKGAALLASPKHDAGVRFMNDLDVLVPVDRLGETIELLAQEGFAPVGDTPSWYARDYLPRLTPSWAFARSDGFHLDLHWHVLHLSCQEDADDDFWSAAIPLELRGVKTRGLCPTDALLHAVLHGLRWNDASPHRWVIDAALIIAGADGPLDYERLVLQARRRRVSTALRAGLAYMRDLVDAPVPRETLRALGAGGPRISERVEFRVLMASPERRSSLQRRFVSWRQYARRMPALGSHRGVLSHIQTARDFLGLSRWRDLRLLTVGGPAGPGRPRSIAAVALGTGTETSAGVTLALGEPLDLTGPDWAGGCVRYGTWLPETGGCWIAGREAGITLALADQPTGSLLLQLWGSHPLAAHIRHARLIVESNGHALGTFKVSAADQDIDGGRMCIPLTAVRGSLIDLTLRAPDVVSPLALGLSDDDRQLGFLLHKLVVLATPHYEIGSMLDFGAGARGLAALGGGWSEPEPAGCWSNGPNAMLLVRIDDAPRALELTLDADPYIGQPGRRIIVDVLANGRRTGTLTYDNDDAERLTTRRVTIAPRRGDLPGELALTFRIRQPASPAQHGLSGDRRKLGIFLRSLRLAP
jgi:hypothetical protein